MGTFELIQFPVGSLTIQGYGLMAALGFAAMWLMLWTTQKKHGIQPGTPSMLMVWGLPLSVLIGRLIYCVVRRGMVFYNPVDGAFLGLWPFFRIWEGGVSTLGMLGGLLLAGVLTARCTKQPFHQVFDWLAAPSALLMAFLQGGAILAGEGYGEILEGPLFLLSLSNEFGEAYRSVFLMEGVIYLMIAFLLHRMRVKRPGGRGLSMVALIASAQLFLESLHRDNYMRLESNGFIRVNQLLCLVMLVAVLLYLSSKDLPHAPKRVALSWGMLLITAVFVIGAEFYEKLPLPTLVLYTLSALSCLGLALVLTRHAADNQRLAHS